MFSDPSVPLDRWRSNHALFVKHNFGVDPDPWQLNVLRHTSARGIDEERYRKIRVAMQACAGTGKSALMAWLITIFQSLYATNEHHPKGVATSVNKANLAGNLWAELAHWHRRSAFLQKYFRWTASKYHHVDHRATWFVEPRAWPRRASVKEIGDSLSGVHGRFCAFFMDESGSTHPAVGDRADQALGDEFGWAMAVQGGNPLDRKSLLGVSVRRINVRTGKPLWFRQKVTADPDDPNRTPRKSIEDARQQIEERGRDNPWVQCFILGEFPAEAINGLVSEEDIEASVNRLVMPEDYEWAATILGADVARGMVDASAITRRQGPIMWSPERFYGLTGVEGAALVAHRWQQFDVDAAFIDNTGGWGQAWIEPLQNLGYAPTPVNYSERDQDPGMFNKRSGMLWRFGQWVKNGGKLPDDKLLHEELLAHTWTIRNDKLWVCEKDDVKLMLPDGRSPDSSDSGAQTFAGPVKPKNLPPELQAAERKRHSKAPNAFARRRKRR